MKNKIEEPAFMYACKFICSENGKKKLVEYIKKFKTKQNDRRKNKRRKE